MGTDEHGGASLWKLLFCPRMGTDEHRGASVRKLFLSTDLHGLAQMGLRAEAFFCPQIYTDWHRGAYVRKWFYPRMGTEGLPYGSFYFVHGVAMVGGVNQVRWCRARVRVMSLSARRIIL